MTTENPTAVTLFHLPAWLRDELGRRFRLVNLHALTRAEADRWLQASGATASAVITDGRTGCRRQLIESLPNLGLIAVYGVGFDNVDLEAARDRGVVVANTPGVLTEDVADLAVGLVISLLRGIVSADEFIRRGCWLKAEFGMKTKVTGKTFGIVGLGRIGKAIAERLSVFGPVLYTGTSVKSVGWTFHDSAVSLAHACDVMIVACAASERTRSLINEEVLSALGERGYLINVARGSIVDENAIVKALTSGKLAGAALDVFQSEPRVAAQLLSCDRVVLTPHIGSATAETREAMAKALLANIDAFLTGQPVPYRVH